MRNGNYIFLLLTFSLMYGVYSSFGAILSNLFDPYDYSGSDISMIGAVFIIFGLIGSFIFGIILDKYAKYLLVLRIICFASLAAGLVMIYTIPLK